MQRGRTHHVTFLCLHATLSTNSNNNIAIINTRDEFCCIKLVSLLYLCSQQRYQQTDGPVVDQMECRYCFGELLCFFFNNQPSLDMNVIYTQYNGIISWQRCSTMQQVPQTSSVYHMQKFKKLLVTLKARVSNPGHLI